VFVVTSGPCCCDRELRHRVLIVLANRRVGIRGSNMNEKDFTELIRRCLSGEASKQEVSRVEEWLNHRTGRDPFSKLGTDEKERIRLAMFDRLSLKTGRVDQTLRRGSSWRRAIGIYGVAAAVTLLCLLSYGFVNFNRDTVEEKITVLHSVSLPGTSKKVMLSDSSIVWLKGNSSLLYSKQFSDDARNVRLTGEALFEVAKDPDRPFVIECEGLRATVLGTSFNIKSNENDVEVFVLTGKVALSSKGYSQDLIVLPNEKAVYHTAGNQLAKVIAEESERAAKIAGTQYSMRFHATRLQEIIRRIEGKFDVQVFLSDEKLNNCTITADFTDQSLDRTLSMISQTLEIQYELNDDQVRLKGTGCD
jgi:transmembrane sensor